MNFKHIVALTLGVSALYSCQDAPMKPDKREEYNREFIKQVGVPGSGHDFNMATQVRAGMALRLPEAQTICVYDRMPGADGCQIAARFSVSSAKSGFLFDFPKSLDRAFVQVLDADGHPVLSGYMPIVDGVLNIGGTASREAGSASDITCTPISNWNEMNSFDTFSFNLPCNRAYWIDERGWNESSDNKSTVAPFMNLYGLSRGNFPDNALAPQFKPEDDGRTMSDLASIVGKKGVFHEGNEGGTNLYKYANILDPASGIVYTANGGEIELEYAYGAGIFDNMMGYFYYNEGATAAEIMNAPKFILMYDASPWTNLQREDFYNQGKNDYENFSKYDGTDSSGKTGNWNGIVNRAGMLPANDMARYEEKPQINNLRYKPSFHKLVYYPVKNGVPDTSAGQYEFPKGTKVGFFIICQGHGKFKYCGQGAGMKIGVNDIRFSIPWMNQLIGNLHDSHSGENYSPVDVNLASATISGFVPKMSFVTYDWNGETIMGVEDGSWGASDHDMNDILFFVHGIEPTDNEDLAKYPTAQSWVVACEDLGSTGDFDFNDVVFGVSYVATDAFNKTLEITPLAAGGTLPVQLHLQGRPISQTWNLHFEGVSNPNAVVNAGPGSHHNGMKGISFTVDDIPQNFTLSADLFHHGEEANPMGGFSLLITNDANHTQAWVKAPGADGEDAVAPQMLLLPIGWQWPTEHTAIYKAYPGTSDGIPGFKDWINNSDLNSWVTVEPISGLTVANKWQGPVVKPEGVE